jgi:hypothetical protein
MDQALYQQTKMTLQEYPNAVQVYKRNKRIYVYSPFNAETVELLKSMKKAWYSIKLREWSFDEESLDAFNEKVDYKSLDNIDMIIFKEKDEVSFKFIDDHDVSLPNQVVPDVTYNPADHVFATPAANYTKLLDYVIVNDIHAVLRNVLPKMSIRRKL